MDVPDTITCVDCGQPAHRMTDPPEFGWQAGDVVAYRCSGCRDRWDLVVDDPASQAASHPLGADFDFRQWLSDREKGKEDA